MIILVATDRLAYLRVRVSPMYFCSQTPRVAIMAMRMVGEMTTAFMCTPAKAKDISSIGGLLRNVQARARHSFL